MKTSTKNAAIAAVRMGRPPVYTGLTLKNILRVVALHGLMRGQRLLATVGIQRKAGQPKEKVNISLPTLAKFAAAAKIKLKRGRPAIES
jgi:hypothetical protein